MKTDKNAKCRTNTWIKKSNYKWSNMYVLNTTPELRELKINARKQKLW